MSSNKVKVVSSDDLLYKTPLIYLKKIHSAYISNTKKNLHTGNKGGMWEQFIPIKEGVLWYFGEADRFPKFISTDICEKIPHMIREKESLMESMEKHYNSRRK